MNADIFDALAQGNAFTNPLPALSGSSLDLIGAGKQSTASLTNIGDAQIQAALAAGGLVPGQITAATGMFTGAATAVGTLTAHGAQSVGNAYSIIGTSVSYKSGLKSIGREPNNCDLINKAFGVVQDLGRQWLGAMEGALATVTAKMKELSDLVAQGVAAGLAKIQALAAEVNGYLNQAITAIQIVIKDITDGIAAELAHIEDMIKHCLNFSFADVLGEWFKDSCAGAVISKIGSPTLNSALKSSV